jgi:aquaporin Z
MSETSTGRNIAAEFVGTTIVMLGGPGLLVLGGADIGALGVALGFGVAIAISIGVIGAVANPMFSLALWFSKGITTGEAVADWVGQLLGAVFGAALIYGLNDATRYTTGTNGWEPTDDIESGVDIGVHLSGFSELGVVIGAELVMSTVLVVVLLSSISQQRSNAAMAAFTGAAYALGTLFLLDISGAGMNPARSLAAAVFADTDPNALGQVWVFIVVPIVAAFAGMLVWLVIDDATIDDTVFDDTILEDVTDAVTGDYEPEEHTRQGHGNS